jgi:UDP-N-acetylglucosamine transferase subunit ALG13
VGSYPKGFDRLVSAVDKLCQKYSLEVVAQIAGGSYKPQFMEYSDFFPQNVQNEYLANCDLVITHGGFGVIGDLLRLGKPFVVFPRPPGEGPNNQVPVAIKLSEKYRFTLCNTESELEGVIKHLSNQHNKIQVNSLECNVPELIFNFLQQDK